MKNNVNKRGGKAKNYLHIYGKWAESLFGLLYILVDAAAIIRKFMRIIQKVFGLLTFCFLFAIIKQT